MYRSTSTGIYLCCLLLLSVVNIASSQNRYSVITYEQAYPEAPPGAVSLCELNDYSLWQAYSLQFGFPFPYFGATYDSLLVDIAMGIYVISPDFESEDFTGLLVSGFYQNFGFASSELSSDVLYYRESDPETGKSCLVIEWKEVGYEFELDPPFFPVKDHYMSFIHRFCSDGTIEIIYGDSDVSDMRYFKEGLGFTDPFDTMYPSGPWVEIRSPDGSQVYGISGSLDSLIVFTEEDMDQYGIFPYFPSKGTTLAFVPDGWTAIDHEIVAQRQVTICPNPAREFIHIQCGFDIAEDTGRCKTLYIQDIYGRHVSSSVWGNEQPDRVDVSCLSPGIYLVTMVSDDGSICSTGRFVKH